MARHCGSLHCRLSHPPQKASDTSQYLRGSDAAAMRHRSVNAGGLAPTRTTEARAEDRRINRSRWTGGTTAGISLVLASPQGHPSQDCQHQSLRVGGMPSTHSSQASTHCTEHKADPKHAAFRPWSGLSSCRPGHSLRSGWPPSLTRRAHRDQARIRLLRPGRRLLWIPKRHISRVAALSQTPTK